MFLVFVVFAFAAGASLALQAAMNSQLRMAVGTPMYATLVSLLVGAAVAVVAISATRSSLPERQMLASGPWWIWCGGLLGMFYLWATIIAAPRLGVAVTFALVVAGQIVTSLVVDQHGLMNMTVQPLNGLKLAGAALVVAGALLVSAGR